MKELIQQRIRIKDYSDDGSEIRVVFDSFFANQDDIDYLNHCVKQKFGNKKVLQAWCVENDYTISWSCYYSLSS